MDQKKQSFLTHLEYLRWHLINSFLAIIMFSAICFLNITNIFDRFIFSLLDSEFVTYRFLCSLSEKFFSDETLCFSTVSLQMQNIELAGQFNMSLLVSFVGGILLAFPYILWELWLFIRPGMYKNETKNARLLIFTALILFFLGSGPIKGFAVTLGTGIFTTLFTVYFIARLLTSLYVIKNKNKESLI